MKPLIGLTPSYDYTERKTMMKYGYQEAVIAAGGIPVIIPPSEDLRLIEEIFERLDGIIFTGGADVDPKYFGEEIKRGTGEISPVRDEMEIFLAKLAIDNNKPVLGICRGIQVMNIAAGGTIYQDIYSEYDTNVKHVQDAPRWYPSHDIYIKEGSMHSKLYQRDKLRVNSFHHQMIKDIGKGFYEAAKSSDGLVEAIEHETNNFCIGVQYHPEIMWEKDIIFLNIFKELINQCIK